MAKSIEAYLDRRGHIHLTPTSAIVADLAIALGRIGEEGGMSEGFARLILEKRVEIERAFADLDQLGTDESVAAAHCESNVEILDLDKKRAKEA